MTNLALRAEQSKRLPVTMAEVKALDRLVAFIKDRKDKPLVADFNAFERDLAERLREVGREVLTDEMRKADVDAPAVLIGGVEHRRVLDAESAQGTYMTTQGPVTIPRALFRDRADSLERTVAPLEVRLGIVEGFWTQNAAKQAVWLVSQMTPALAEETFSRVGNMMPSKSSLDRLPKALSDRWEEHREEFEAQLRRTIVVPENASSVAVSLDGVLVPMKDGDAPEVRRRAAIDGRTSQGPAGYREVGCATISFCDEDGEMLSAIRIARMPEYKKSTLKDMMLAELAAIYEQRPDLNVVKLADAANDNWDFLHRRVRVGKEVVDFYHATEHLSDALAAAYGDGTREMRLRFEELGDILLNEPDGVERVIRSLGYLRTKHPRSATIEKELKFFRKNRRRMRYAELRAAGLPVGSGVCEAACKTLVAQRLKQSGMRWGMEGGQAILTFRGWSQSDRFDHGWALIAATYKIEVTLLERVVGLDDYKKRRKPRSR